VAGIALAVGIAPATATAQQNERGCDLGSSIDGFTHFSLYWNEVVVNATHPAADRYDECDTTCQDFLTSNGETFDPTRERHHLYEGALELVVDLSDPLEPVLVATFRLDRQVRGLRASGTFVYVDSPHHRGLLPVVDVTNPLQPRIAGAHEVRAWVRGAVVQEDWAYRAKSWGVQLASVER
jgi:hypothetical protein